MKKVKLTSNIILPILGNSVFTKYNTLNNASDETLKTGIYGINTELISTSNLPSGVSFGMMIVFNGVGSSGNPIVQVVFDNVNNKVYYRVKWDIYSFKPWILLT